MADGKEASDSAPAWRRGYQLRMALVPQHRNPQSLVTLGWGKVVNIKRCKRDQRKVLLRRRKILQELICISDFFTSILYTGNFLNFTQHRARLLGVVCIV